jgi:hypothetical protein
MFICAIRGSAPLGGVLRTAALRAGVLRWGLRCARLRFRAGVLRGGCAARGLCAGGRGGDAVKVRWKQGLPAYVLRRCSLARDADQSRKRSVRASAALRRKTYAVTRTEERRRGWGGEVTLVGAEGAFGLRAVGRERRDYRSRGEYRSRRPGSRYSVLAGDEPSLAPRPTMFSSRSSQREGHSTWWSANAYNSVAEALHVAGDRAGAILNCQKALERGPQNAIDLYERLRRLTDTDALRNAPIVRADYREFKSSTFDAVPRCG